MLLPLSHRDWQVLRAVLRARRPVPGRALRLNMSRNTKDGAFLDGLVTAGLLAAEPLRSPDPDDPPAFQQAYTITPLGRQAAEYGEYEADLETVRRMRSENESAKGNRE